MQALEYRKSIPRYALLKLFGRRFRGLYTSGVPPFTLREMEAPRLHTPQWVRIAPHLTGICGSDLSTICAKGTPYLAPMTSMPFVMGHEIVGHITEVGDEARGFSVGDRVVIHPALGCAARGIHPECQSCRDGRDALCSNVTRGDISKGIQTGFCRDTGGGFSESVVAHQSQVYRVPDSIDDRAAVLIEPFACAVHGAFRAELSDSDTALVIGCGSIGLLTIAALRARGLRCRIVAVARYDHQRELASMLGADVLLDSRGPVKDRYRRWAGELEAEVLDPELGKPTVIGGAAAVFDCVATSESIDDGLRFTRSAGTFVLVGMPGMPRQVDWTPMWFKELTVHAAYAYGPERYLDGTRETFDLALEMIESWGEKLSHMVGDPFALKDHRAALASALRTGESRVAKTVFAVHDGNY
ncbi:MAG: zinc-dependent alcohol dehydrogenase [Planctomycetota bacterium]|jgi:threonine dehydrogenase-like Zn-dependent dehydrogenase